MKITIISPFSFGYIDALAAKLKELNSVDLVFINTHEINFTYSSNIQKLGNLFLKTFMKRNLKKEFQTKEISRIIKEEPIQDVILVIRPDKLEKKLLEILKTRTNSLKTFYFDGIENFPKKVALIPFFDEVYSYDRRDVEKYDLKFIPNFIPADLSVQNPKGEGVFNISSFDDRFPILENIASQLKKAEVPYKIIVRKEKPYESKHVEIVRDYLLLKEVEAYMQAAGVLLDIQKDNQLGLSFRVFEALGYDKKLITTNKDIKHYDFYEFGNILIIDKQNPVIPKDFLLKPYNNIPDTVKDKYRRKAWISEVFGVV